MKIILTGGTGFIGSALVSSLSEEGHTLYVLSRNPENHRDRLPNTVILKKWSVEVDENLLDALEGCDAIINLAGESIAGRNLAEVILKRWSKNQVRIIQDSRINTGKVLTKALGMINKKPSVLIQASAVGFYGNRGNELLTEKSLPGNDTFANLCVNWEASTAEVEKMGIRQAVIRTPGIVLSTRGGSLPFLMLPYKFFLGGPLGSGSQWISWVHLHDEIDAIKFLLTNHDLSGAFNLASPAIVTQKEFSRTLGNLMRRPSYLPIPTFLLKLILGEKANVLIASQRQIPERLQELGFQFSFPDLSNALEDIITNRN